MIDVLPGHNVPYSLPLESTVLKYVYTAVGHRYGLRCCERKMSVLVARAARGAATPVREKLDLVGINRNHCLGVVFAVLGCLFFGVYSVLQAAGACYNSATCPSGKEESVLCNCAQFKWSLGGIGLGVGLFLCIYEVLTGEGTTEMRATRARAAGVEEQFLEH